MTLSYKLIILCPTIFMSLQNLSPLLYFYGLFLGCCGIASVTFIGIKAKTALISGGTSGLIACLLAYLTSKEMAWAPIAGIGVSFALFIVFSWRSSKTLFKIFELIQDHVPNDGLKGKGIAFLIISLMAVVSIFVFVLLVINL